jgi:hypothetical protein
MSNSKFTRRTFIKATGLMTVAAVSRIYIPESLAAPSSAEQQVPNSSGTEAPKLKAPGNACDCHIHVYDDRFPPPGPAKRLVTKARVEEYRLLKKRIGTTRTVIVTPSAYATDNAVTLDGIAQLGLANARGVAVPSRYHGCRAEENGGRGHPGDSFYPF